MSADEPWALRPCRNCKVKPRIFGRAYCSDECRERMGAPANVKAIVADVLAERDRQIKNWPDCESLPNGTGEFPGRATYMRIAKDSCDRAYREGRITHAYVFEEEVSEVLAERDPEKLEVELIQVAAVCFKWAADIRRKRAAAAGGAP